MSKLTKDQARQLLAKCTMPNFGISAVFPPQYILATQGTLEELGINGSSLKNYILGGGTTEDGMNIHQIALERKKLEAIAGIHIEDANPAALQLKQQCENPISGNRRSR